MTTPNDFKEIESQMNSAMAGIRDVYFKADPLLSARVLSQYKESLNRESWLSRLLKKWPWFIVPALAAATTSYYQFIKKNDSVSTSSATQTHLETLNSQAFTGSMTSIRNQVSEDQVRSKTNSLNEENSTEVETQKLSSEITSTENSLQTRSSIKSEKSHDWIREFKAEASGHGLVWRVDLTWQNLAKEPEQILVYQSIGGAPFSEVGEVIQSKTSFSVAIAPEQLDWNQTYTFKLETIWGKDKKDRFMSQPVSVKIVPAQPKLPQFEMTYSESELTLNYQFNEPQWGDRIVFEATSEGGDSFTRLKETDEFKLGSSIKGNLKAPFDRAKPLRIRAYAYHSLFKELRSSFTQEKTYQPPALPAAFNLVTHWDSQTHHVILSFEMSDNEHRVLQLALWVGRDLATMKSVGNYEVFSQKIEAIDLSKADALAGDYFLKIRSLGKSGYTDSEIAKFSFKPPGLPSLRKIFFYASSKLYLSWDIKADKKNSPPSLVLIEHAPFGSDTYSVLATLPANLGIAEIEANNPPFEKDGKFRIKLKNDMGESAYSENKNFLFADVDGNCVVDNEDFNIIDQHDRAVFGTPVPPPFSVNLENLILPWDINGDGVCTFHDMRYFNNPTYNAGVVGRHCH